MCGRGHGTPSLRPPQTIPYCGRGIALCQQFSYRQKLAERLGIDDSKTTCCINYACCHPCYDGQALEEIKLVKAGAAAAQGVGAGIVVAVEPGQQFMIV